jgi:alkylation response protein AidB-like acyl-CoA dehydrogenase
MARGEADLVRSAVKGLLAEHTPDAPRRDFLGALFDAGLAWVHFAPGCGGLGVDGGLQSVVLDELAAAGAPTNSGAAEDYVGVHQAGAAIHAFAPPQWKHRWLRAIFTSEEVWCQLFSEPGSGSDLAGLSTSAVRDGDEWIVNGQKVWTSFGHCAQWGLLLARTDPTVPKHRGLTLFAVDMTAAGIEARPLRTMNGGSEFSEVFLDDVRIPDEYRLGEVGQGWGAAMGALSTERVGIVDNPSPLPPLLETWWHRRNLGSLEAVYRDRVAAAYARAEAARLLADRSRHQPAFAPLVKLARNLTDQEIGNLIVDILGTAGLLGGEYDWEERGSSQSPQLQFLYSRSATIGAGTDQIMRNLISEKILGLPAEPNSDKGLPWNQTLRH